jgi:hypothetical protein
MSSATSSRPFTVLLRGLAAVLAGLLVPVLAAQGPTLNPAHPGRYTVVPGDTLWGIAVRYLEEPWRWPEIWQVNPQIENPHLIYPGDVLDLSLEGGRPAIRVTRGRPIVKLSPRVREEPLVQPIPTIPMDAIQQFLTRHRVVGPGELEAAPYVVAQADGRLISATADRVYVRGVAAEIGQRYGVVRDGGPYLDPDAEDSDDALLGYAAMHVGNGRLERLGDPATVRVLRAEREILIGDRLLPEEERALSVHFLPKAPSVPVQGRIIAVMDGVSRVAQYQVVVLSRGERDGLEEGDVLAVYQAGNQTTDPITGERITLPEERAGLLMVFRTFERVSFGLIMDAQREMRVLDVVRNP